MLHEPGYLPQMLSRSRYKRWLHGVKELFLVLLGLLGEHFKTLNEGSLSVMDSFPIATCDNIHIRWCRLYQGRLYRGYCHSKGRYFYGLRLHLLVTASGQPVECFLTPGRDNDSGCLDLYDFDLPPGARVVADKGFTHHQLADVLAPAEVALCPLGKSNSTHPIPPWERFLRASQRKRIETVGSQITPRFPKAIHAVTQAGFELKLVLFVLAHSFDAL